jgi:hypothetical protein
LVFGIFVGSELLKLTSKGVGPRKDRHFRLGWRGNGALIQEVGINCVFFHHRKKGILDYETDNSR